MEMWSMQNNGVDLMPAMPRIQVIRGFLMNHLCHHRGELIAYLRVNGKRVPGLYGPSYEEALAAQNDNAELKAQFTPLAEKLASNEAKINEELIAAQGKPVDIAGYYSISDELAEKAMRPSTTLNEALASL